MAVVGGEGRGEEEYRVHIHCLYHCRMPMPCALSLPQNYEGDVSDLCLTFSWDEDFMGKVLQWCDIVCVCRCVGVQVCGCAGVWVCGCAGVVRVSNTYVTCDVVRYS